VETIESTHEGEYAGESSPEEELPAFNSYVDTRYTQEKINNVRRVDEIENTMIMIHKAYQMQWTAPFACTSKFGDIRTLLSSNIEHYKLKSDASRCLPVYPFTC
jgi:hypothetical protein